MAEALALWAIDPDVVLFPNAAPAHASIQIKNTSTQTMTFKVTTTAPKYFRIRPSSGSVEPGASQTVTILQSEPTDLTCARFLVQANFGSEWHKRRLNCRLISWAVDPDVVLFPQSTSGSQASVAIKNTSQDVMQFKIETTKPKAFTVTPHAGPVQPGESQKILFTMMSDAAPTDEPLVRFRVQAAFASVMQAQTLEGRFSSTSGLDDEAVLVEATTLPTVSLDESLRNQIEPIAVDASYTRSSDPVLAMSMFAGAIRKLSILEWGGSFVCLTLGIFDKNTANYSFMGFVFVVAMSKKYSMLTQLELTMANHFGFGDVYASIVSGPIVLPKTICGVPLCFCGEFVVSFCGRPIPTFLALIPMSMPAYFELMTSLAALPRLIGNWQWQTSGYWQVFEPPSLLAVMLMTSMGVHAYKIWQHTRNMIAFTEVADSLEARNKTQLAAGHWNDAWCSAAEASSQANLTAAGKVSYEMMEVTAAKAGDQGGFVRGKACLGGDRLVFRIILFPSVRLYLKISILGAAFTELGFHGRFSTLLAITAGLLAMALTLPDQASSCTNFRPIGGDHCASLRLSMSMPSHPRAHPVFFLILTVFAMVVIMSKLVIVLVASCSKDQAACELSL